MGVQYSKAYTSVFRSNIITFSGVNSKSALLAKSAYETLFAELHFYEVYTY
jgi:hypothetical protein